MSLNTERGRYKKRRRLINRGAIKNVGRPVRKRLPFAGATLYGSRWDK